MGSSQFRSGRFFLMRAPYESDIIAFLTDFAKKHGITTATFTAMGALKSATLAYYDQQKREYLKHPTDMPQEIASCVGNISTKEGEPFVHAHAVLSDKNGNTKAGHLLEGKVFAAEIHLVELLGEKIERRHDAVTGLSLWGKEERQKATKT